MHIQCANTVSRSTSLGLIAFFLAACTCKPFVWDSKPGVTSYILLYEPVLKRADKSFREDVWSTEDEKQHTVQSLWDPGPKSGQDSGLSIISSDPGRLGGSQLRASTDSRGLKKSDTSAQCCLESNMSNALQRYYFSYLLPTNIYREGSEGLWLMLSAWIFPCLHFLPVWGGPATCPGCVQAVCGS